MNSKLGIISQVLIIDPRNLSKKVQNVALQMLNKIGFTPWIIKNPTPNPKSREKIMMIGADVYHKRGNDSVAAVIGTLDGQFTKFCSFHSVQPVKGQEIMKNISAQVLNCVKEYKIYNKSLPTTIIFYRDGVGQGQLDIVKKQEVKTIQDSLLEKFGDKSPKLVFLVVTKRLNDRFFGFDESNKGNQMY